MAVVYADAPLHPQRSDDVREAPMTTTTTSPPHTLEQAEIEMIRATVEAVGGNISAASKRLGVSRNTIYRKLRWNVGDPPG
jgi:transcriptional regulator of acetoin/glycerol metabolism